MGAVSEGEGDKRRDDRVRELVEQMGLDPLDAQLAVAIADGELPHGDVIIVPDDETEGPPRERPDRAAAAAPG